MKRFSRRMLALTLFGTLSSAPLSAQTKAIALAIDRVTVVDVRTGMLRRGQTVAINDGKIVQIVRTGSTRIKADRRIDANGQFLVPGFNDMHAHNLNAPSPTTSLPVMLAYGITGFRQMAGAAPLLAARSAGKPILPPNSPGLLAMPGAIIAGPAFAQPEAVVAEINRQKLQGADFIKVVDLPRSTFLAAADAARANGLPYAGHLPPTVDTRDALKHNMTSIEHLGPGISLLLNCSRDEAAIRAILAGLPPSVHGIDFNMPPAQLLRLLANPMLLTPPPGFLLMRRVLSTYDEAKCRAFAKDVADSQTWMVPTLTRLEAMDLGNDLALRTSPDLRYVPADVRTVWSEVGSDFDSKLNPDQRQVLVDLFARQLQLAKLLDTAGVKMLAGTDFGGQWIAPGASLHREFDLAARAGLSPLRILQMTTLNPATFLGREATMGTVEVGRAADLVLLASDPTKSAANLHGVEAVVRSGRFYSRAELDDIKAQAASSLR